MHNKKDFEIKVQECADYIKHIYSKIVFHPEDIIIEYEMGSFIHFIINANTKDDGILIGRRGATINAVRLFIHAYSKSHLEGAPCIVEVKDHGGSKFNPVMSDNPYRRR